MVKNLILDLGFDEKISAHKLRHSCATLMLGVGVSIRDIQEVLGHQSIKSTSVYTHVLNETVSSAIQSNPLADQKRVFIQEEPKKRRKKAEGDDTK